MRIRCVWEHNGDDSILYADNFIGVFTRGPSKDLAIQKMPAEIKSYLMWKDNLIPDSFGLEIVQEKRSEYTDLKALALKSAQDFLTLYQAMPDKDKSCLPVRATFYGQIPRTAFQMYEHTKNVNNYYFGEIGVSVDNEGSILECRERGFALLESQPDFLKSKNRSYCRRQKAVLWGGKGIKTLPYLFWRLQSLCLQDLLNLCRET